MEESAAPVESSETSSDVVNEQPIETQEALPDAPKERPEFYQYKTSDIEEVDDLSAKPKWYITKDQAGDGDRPEWLPEGKTMEEEAKRAGGLRKQLSQVTHAPEEYVTEIDKDTTELFGITSDDPLINEFKEIAIAGDISQDTYNALLNFHFENRAGERLSNIEFQEGEFKRLGIDAEQTYNRLNNWANNNLDAEEAEIMSNMSLTAPTMKLMTSIINKFAGSTNIPGDVQQSYISPEDKINKLKGLLDGGIGSEKQIRSLYNIKG